MKNTFAFCFLFFATSNLLAQAPPSYARQVRPFLAKYCLECHNAKALKGGLNLETFKSMLEGSDKGPVVSAGKPEQSPLVTAVEGKTKPAMPPKTAKFHPKAEETALVRAWVQSGAKDDSNLIKVVIPDIKPRKLAQAPVTSVAYDPAAPFLALGKHKLLELVDLKNGIVTDHPQLGNVTALAFSPRGSWLAVAFGSPGESGSVLLRGLGNSPPPTQTFPNLHKDAILDVAISSDGKLLASCSYDMQIKITSLEDQLYSRSPARVLKDHSDAAYAVAFSPDGKRLASCSADRAVKVWDVATGKLLYTLGDATDWLYTVAWSSDGKRLASGGVDKSIRVYEANPGGAKIIHSVFAHEAAVQKVVFSRDGKTLYSLGQDRVLKAWDSERMVEAKTYERLPDTGLCLAVRPGEIAVGRYDGVTQILNAATGKVLHELAAGTSKTLTRIVDPFPTVAGREGNASPGTGQMLKLPASVIGKLGKAGDFNFFRFEVTRGQQLGVRAVTKEAGSKVAPYLQLTDQRGTILVEANEGFLGYTFPDAGVYALGIRDQEFRGGADMHYRLHLGDIPVVTSLFPLGLERGTEGDIHIQGVYLSTDNIHVKVPRDAEPGSKISVPVSSSHGKPLGKLEIVAGEFPELLLLPKQDSPPGAGTIPVPGTANGRLSKAGQSDTWQFTAKKGRRLVVEIDARRLGSALDSILDILDPKGDPVPRAVLRCQAKTYVTFRDHDSASPNIRIEAWAELGVNDLIYVGSDLMKIKELPTHPDADCSFFGAGGQRRGYLDTTPTHHSMNEPMYKVTVHPPGTTFPPNGYPVFTLYYRNDDGGPGYGRDSRILFDPPADGDYLVRVGDARGQGGDHFGYRLTVRPPRPSFNVRFSPTSPVVPRGGASAIQVSADRLDGYEGPINVHLESLPPGFSAPPTTIEAGQAGTDFALYADNDAKTPPGPMPLRLIAEAAIAGENIKKEAAGETPKVKDRGEIVASTEQSEITVHPGGQVKLTVHIERRQGFLGRVPLDVRGLPHGVRVLDIGLNGILVNENEVRRTIVIYAEPWVEASSHPLVISARREGKNSEHAAKAVILKVAGK